MLKNIRKVVVGISGGVDSAVAALLIKQKGYDIQGVFMQNWDIADEKGFCSADADYNDAVSICDKLNIKLTKVNFVKEYWNEVFCDLVKEYENGFTPNPDILCNRHIKFHHFYNYAFNELKADAIATGHYAITSFGPFLENYNPKSRVRLYLATDSIKDQTFFLCQAREEALRKTMFPLGNLMKSEVKKIAIENGFERIAKKKESMGICFIGNRKFQDFIREYIPDKPGDFVDIDTSKPVGRHNGVHQWTLGQRARIQTSKEPYFIVRKDISNNIIYVGKGTKHPALYTNLIFTQKPYWIHSKPEDLQNGDILNCNFKFMHTKNWVSSEVAESDKGLVIRVGKFKRAVTPGQYAILAKNGELLGSAKIANTGVSHFGLYYLQNNRISNEESVIDKYVCKDDEGEFTDNEDMKVGTRNR